MNADRDTSEAAAFAALQARLPDLFRRQFADPLSPRSVVVVPSLSFHREELEKISGVNHYEERMLCMLLLLRLPRTHVIYLTSQQLDPIVVDYHLHLLTGIPGHHARRRLHLFSAQDGSPVPLTQKLLDRPRLLERIRQAIGDPAEAHMNCFTSTPLERSLAVRLGVPLYACDPALLHLGTKSGSRRIMRRAGIDVPAGYEDLRDGDDIADALIALHGSQPSLRRAVVKLNDGFSGEGNAIFDFASCGDDVERCVRDELGERLRFEGPGESWERYEEKLRDMQGIVEVFVEGPNKRSPSAQFRINPLRKAMPVSTHDQVLAGPSGQVFVGCTFPADPAYRLEIQECGQRVAEIVRDEGVIGRLAIDFVSVPEGDGWRHYGLEINLRKGGTTHPLMVLHYLTDGQYDKDTGLFMTPAGQPRFYFASDNVECESYRGLLPDDLIDIVVDHRLHFNGPTQQGVAFHLIGALSEHGKLGMVCIGDGPEAAEELRARTVSVLDDAVSSTG
jgi:hypothetical protein